MFNTLKYARILEDVGFSREQAEVQIQIIADIIEGSLATKQDLKELEYRLTIKLGAVAVITITVLVAILKLT